MGAGGIARRLRARAGGSRRGDGGAANALARVPPPPDGAPRPHRARGRPAPAAGDPGAAGAAHHPPWPVSAPALPALVAGTAPAARAEAAAVAAALDCPRRALIEALPPGVDVVGEPRSSFVLLQVPGGARVREALRDRGWAVRRGDTFPGLSPDHLRVAVRDPGTSRAFAAALAAILSRDPAPEEAR